MTLCPQCKRPMNVGNSPNVSECTETDDEACEAFKAGRREGLFTAASEVDEWTLSDGIVVSGSRLAKAIRKLAEI